MDIRDGKLRIPEFQRPLRWRSAHVLDFFDSVYRGFPVGELLLSKRSAEPRLLHFGPLRVDAPAVPDALFVVDGQQRINALAGALLHPDTRPRGDIHAVWFDLQAERFVRSRSAEPPPHWIPLNVISDSFLLLGWLHEWPFGKQRPDLVQRAIALGKAIREYQIPAYVVEEASKEALRLIFKRANTSGVPMKESEVFEALFDGAGPRPIESACARLQEQTGFGVMERDWFLRCLKAVEGRDPRHTFTEREGDATEVRASAVEETETSLRRAIAFLADDAGILHLQLLPYRLPLILLARFFHLHPSPHPRTRTLLVRWIWRGALAGVHTDSSHATVNNLQSKIDRDEFASVERLLFTVPKDVEPPAASTVWSGHSAATRLCAVAMLHMDPRNVDTGEAYTLQEVQRLLDRRDLAKIFRDVGRDAPSTVARRVLLPGSKQIARLPHAPEEVLRSHGLDRSAADALLRGDISEFVEHRQRELDRWFQRFFSERSAPGEADRLPIAELVRRVEAQAATT
ncbi:DUF262 domain-containing protein [Sorangium sp. So ce693]|uniref:DUF262 domain-containing protein n=1 Tax=Sorangium sp. So ce693 TaxID=3133318 RepID=UPI003F5FB6CE